MLELPAKERREGHVEEGHGNFVRMLQVTEPERYAVEAGAAALAELAERLKNTPTPAGPSPNHLVQIASESVPPVKTKKNCPARLPHDFVR